MTVLMQVYLPAIIGHVPQKMVRTFSAIMDFCYLARRAVQDQDSLTAHFRSLQAFFSNRDIFPITEVREDFNLPQQHVILHYLSLIPHFGAPNSICSSITKSHHIKAVKILWHSSNCHNAIGQMLKLNQCQDKLAASRTKFMARGMLTKDVLKTSTLSALVTTHA